MKRSSSVERLLCPECLGPIWGYSEDSLSQKGNQGHPSLDGSLLRADSAPAEMRAAAIEKAATQRRVREVEERLSSGEFIYGCAKYVTNALENNPRRLKQFVNLLRLRLYLAGALKVLDRDTLWPGVTTVKKDMLSGHQIAKFVALDLTCPQSMNKVRNRELLYWTDLASAVAEEQKMLATVFALMLRRGEGPVYSMSEAVLPLYFQQLAAVAVAEVK